MTCSLCVPFLSALQPVGKGMALSAEYALCRMGGSVLPAAVVQPVGEGMALLAEYALCRVGGSVSPAAVLQLVSRGMALSGEYALSRMGGSVLLAAWAVPEGSGTEGSGPCAAEGFWLKPAIAHAFLSSANRGALGAGREQAGLGPEGATEALSG